MPWPEIPWYCSYHNLSLDWACAHIGNIIPILINGGVPRYKETMCRQFRWGIGRQQWDVYMGGVQYAVRTDKMIQCDPRNVTHTTVGCTTRPYTRLHAHGCQKLSWNQSRGITMACSSMLHAPRWGKWKKIQWTVLHISSNRRSLSRGSEMTQ